MPAFPRPSRSPRRRRRATSSTRQSSRRSCSESWTNLAELTERVDRVALLKRACDALDHANARIRELESRPASDDASPIAIVGLACRFPGADSPEAYWRMLASGTDAVSSVPPGRWPVDVDRLFADQPSDVARR